MAFNTTRSSDWMNGPDDQDQPSLYRSPSQDMTQSRGSSSFTITSPLPFLADTVNSIIDGYAPIAVDQGWQSTRFLPNGGSYPEQVPNHGFALRRSNGSSVSGSGYAGQDIDMKTWDLGSQSGNGQWGMPVQNLVPGRETMVNGSSMPSAYSMQDGANPFASASTAQLKAMIAANMPSSQHYDDVNPNYRQSYAPTSELFQPPVDTIDVHTANFQAQPQRSPSPLVEVDRPPTTSPSPSPSSIAEDDIADIAVRRRASDSDGVRSKVVPIRRMSAHLPMEEKLLRAQATEGLNKQDKRRVQNKLAQRAFRARSKVANRHVFTRLEHLEELTEQQADRILKMTDLVGRLQKENTGLKKDKFEEALAIQVSTAVQQAAA